MNALGVLVRSSRGGGGFGLRVVLAVALAIFALACGRDSSTQEGPVGAVTGSLTGPTLSPKTASIPANVEQQFVVRPVLRADVWTVGDPTIASVSATGLATGLMPGTTTIDVNGLSAKLTVTTATLKAVRVSEVKRVGRTAAPITFIATGLFSDHTSFALRAATTHWTSSDVAIATIAQTGVVTPVSSGTVVLTATDQVTGLSGSAKLTVTTPPVTSVVVSPKQLTIPVGALGTFKASALFGPRTVDKHADIAWSVSDPTVASVSETGEVTGLAVGKVTVSAMEIGSGVIGTAALTMTSDATVQVQVTCAGRAACTLGADQNLKITATATAITSAGRRTPLSWTPTWTSSNVAIATVTSTGQPTCTPRQLRGGGGGCSNAEPGQITGVSPGIATITATDPISGFKGSVKVTVKPVTLVSVGVSATLPRGVTLATVPVGVDVPLVATAVYRITGTTTTFKADVTTQTAWSSSAPKVAIVSNAPGSVGVATAIAKGSATITGAFGSRAGTKTITVVPGTLKSITVSPQIATLPDGATQQLKATATYVVGRTRGLVTFDVTDTVVWASDSAGVVVANAAGSPGLATAVSPGTAAITATDPDTGMSGTAWLTVSPASLVSLAITPPSPSLGIGLTQQFRASGTFSDGTHRDLTDTVLWTSTAKAVAPISNAAGSMGLATAVAPGVASIGAFDPTTGVVAPDATIRVTAATLTSLTISPPTATIADGFTQQFTATGNYSDGAHQDLTGVVTWSVVSGTATVSNAAGSSGLATSAGPGASTLQAVDPTSGLAATATLNVTAATLVSIAVTPAAPSVPAGTTQAFAATGAFSDGSHLDLTASVTWSSSQPALFGVSNDPASPGLGQAIAPGSAIVSATDPATGVTGTATVTVANALLASISVTPATASVQSGTTQQFTAIGVYTDASTRDLTQLVTWSSSGPSATISNAAGSQGLATAASAGSATITALDPASGLSGAATMTTVVPVLSTPEFTYGEGPVGNGDAGGTLSAGTLVTIGCDNLPANGVINFTTDGTIPTASSPVYAGPVAITSAMTLIAVASAPNYASSALRTASFVLPCQTNCTQVLATSSAINEDVAVDATSVYFTNAVLSTVSKVPLNGGPVTTIASGSAAFEAYAIAVDDTGVYWTTHNAGGMVMKASLDGSVLTTIATGQSFPHDIAVDATNVYWLNIGDGSVMQAPRNGGALTTIATGQNNPYRIAVDATNVYWTNFAQTTDIMGAPIGSGEMDHLAFGQDTPLGMAADGTSIYWTSFSGGTISSAPTSGDPITILASGQIFPYDVISDGTNVYWSTKFNPGTIAKVPVGGGAVTIIASGLSSPSNLALDATSIYWVSEGDGNVMRAPK